MNAIKIISIILGMLLGASILSGSSISIQTWYSAPYEFSVLLISIIVPISLMIFIHRILMFAFRKNRKS